MSLKKWFARKGAVGSTARWAAKGYWLQKKQNPAQPIEEIMKFLVASRYFEKGTEVPRNSLVNLINRGQINGLAHLVTNILSIEAGCQENTPENRNVFREVIMEELSKCGIPEKDIYDFSSLYV